MTSLEPTSQSGSNHELENEAAELFTQRLFGEWREQDQVTLESRLAGDVDFARAYRHVEESWRALDAHADAPEIMAYRAEAIETLRRANARRWFEPETGQRFTSLFKAAAAAVGLAAVLAIWKFTSTGEHTDEYRTAIGEQRMLELEDHSRIAIDAASHLLVRYTRDARSIQLLDGQAQFSVAKDPSRPFKVTAGNRTIVAVGTVFTVEYVDRRVHVAMVEGKVAVLAHSNSNERAASAAGQRAVNQSVSSAVSPSQPGNNEIYLTAGQELRVGADGSETVTPKADIAAAIAWREGKVIFRTTSLGDAVNRMNRYSRLQVRIDDPALADQNVSGVFEAGDTAGFVSALQRYLPLDVEYPDANTVRLKAQARPAASTPALQPRNRNTDSAARARQIG